MRVLELFSGIGGLAEALGPDVEILAVDQSPLAATVYRANCDHRVLERNIESLDEAVLRRFDAQLWWASPPCQPYTGKGMRRQLTDSRSDGFRGMLTHLERIRPPFFAMENVAGFAGSEGEALLRGVLERSGYHHLWSLIICPTELGVPNRRPRFYLSAGRSPLGSSYAKASSESGPLITFLERDEPDDRYDVPPAMATRFASAMHVIEPLDESEIANCFASGYGRSIVRCGSYVRRSDGSVRHFTPREIARLLGFPDSFVLPDALTDRQLWKLLGNSLSVPAVRTVLSRIPSGK
jgi:site-specific DNA-cytosine methylase